MSIQSVWTMTIEYRNNREWAQSIRECEEAGHRLPRAALCQWCYDCEATAKGNARFHYAAWPSARQAEEKEEIEGACPL